MIHNFVSDSITQFVRNKSLKQCFGMTLIIDLLLQHGFALIEFLIKGILEILTEIGCFAFLPGMN